MTNTTAYIASDLEVENKKLRDALKCAKDALDKVERNQCYDCSCGNLADDSLTEIRELMK